jgi:uncharacterized membrane protein
MHDTAWWSTWPGALMIGLMVLIAGLLIWLVMRSRNAPGTTSAGPAPAAREDDAVAQARMRYARGELDREGFTQVMQDLTGRPSAMAAAPAAAAPPTESPESPTEEPA